MALGGFALVLSLCALGLGGYQIWRGQALPELRAEMERLQPQITRQQTDLARLEQNNSARAGQYQQQLQQLQYQLQQSQQREVRLLSRVDALSNKVRSLEGSTRSHWRIAEVEYLLNLANQRLLTVKDVAGSHELLTSADKILEQVDDYSLFPLRQALAEDLAVLQTATQVNRQNIWLQLQGIADLISNLAVLNNPQHLTKDFQPATGTAETNVSAPERDWQKIAENTLMDIWQRFTSLFRITTQRAEPVEIFLTNEQEQLIRQKMQLLLEQSQLALITGQQSIYQLSLKQASEWLSSYFAIGSDEGKKLSDELTRLSDLTIVPKVPTIQRSLEALKALNSSEPEPANTGQPTVIDKADDQTASEPASTGQPATSTPANSQSVAEPASTGQSDASTVTDDQAPLAKPATATSSPADGQTATEPAKSGEPHQ